MLHRIMGSNVITTPFLRFETDSGVALSPSFSTGGTATFEWISPDGSISTGAIPNPVLDQSGVYTVKCSDWSDITLFDCRDDNVIALDNLVLLSIITTLHCFTNSIVVLDVSALTSLVTLNCYDNNIEILDISALVLLQTVYCYTNSIASLDVSLLTVLTNLRCANNGMSEAAVDHILEGLVTAGANNGQLIAHGTNAAPSAAGLANKAILEGRGWSVTVSA